MAQNGLKRLFDDSTTPTQIDKVKKNRRKPPTKYVNPLNGYRSDAADDYDEIESDILIENGNDDYDEQLEEKVKSSPLLLIHSKPNLNTKKQNGHQYNSYNHLTNGHLHNGFSDNGYGNGIQQHNDLEIKRIEENQNLIISKLDKILDNLKYLNDNCMLKNDFNSIFNKLCNEVIVNIFIFKSSIYYYGY